MVDTLTFEWAKKALGVGALDFMRLSHRVAIGKALVCHLHGDSFDEYSALMKAGAVPQDHLAMPTAAAAPPP